MLTNSSNIIHNNLGNSATKSESQQNSVISYNSCDYSFSKYIYVYQRIITNWQKHRHR